ncbi:hypothetical protein C0J52_03967 [Blattella germanica]|nr:hypothetical protein C0J52_03967 [Blattella germanica]
MGHCLQILKRDAEVPNRIHRVQYEAVGTIEEVQVLPSLGKNSKPMQEAIEDCSSLQNLLHQKVPATFANDITANMLVCIDGIYKDIQKWIKEPWCSKILLELVSAIIHPSITELDLHYTLSFISKYLFARLNTMTKLKELKLYNLNDQTSEPLIIEGLYNMESLQVLTIHYHCSDSIVIAVGNKCTYLKSLDIAFSKSVTDASISSLLKLVHLEEIDLTDTCISGKGYMKLINEINCDVKNRLQKFGCSQIQTTHMTVLLRDFPSLVEVNIRRYRHNSDHIASELKALKVLRLTDCRFQDVEELLLATGSHLIELELNKIKDFNVRVIGEKCLTVQKLTINGYVRYVPQYEDDDVGLPGFQSLEHISLNLYRDYSFIAYILSECKNLKQVDLFITDGSEQETEDTVEFILSKNSMQCLEEFSIRTHMAGFLTQKIVMLLIENCPNITVLRGVNTWSSIGNLEDYIEEMAENYPNIHLSE